MNSPPKTRWFHSAYMRRLISSVKAFASLDESFLPISRVNGFSELVMGVAEIRLQTKTGFFDTFFQVRPLFLAEWRRRPTRETLHRQPAQLHQLAIHAAAMASQVFS